MATERRTMGDRNHLTVVVDREAPLIAAAPRLDGNVIARRLRELPVTETRPVYSVFKRAFDVLVASLAILATLPVFVLIAVLIKLDSRGPVFYKQERLGKNTMPFTMWKFRSMRTNSESIPEELLLLNESTGPLFKMRSDPRITRVGRFLRRTSLDELPQIFNVLTGSMSVVGPRPPLPRELPGFEVIQRQRLQVKPGLAGLWQVSGRSNIPFAEMVRLDLEYVERRSMWFDIVLILKTIPCVLTGKGAY